MLGKQAASVLIWKPLRFSLEPQRRELAFGLKAHLAENPRSAAAAQWGVLCGCPYLPLLKADSLPPTQTDCILRLAWELLCRAKAVP